MFAFVAVMGLLGVGCGTEGSGPDPQPTAPGDDPIGSVSLPQPSIAGEVSLEESLVARRSIRQFTDEPLSPNDLSQLLWAAQGQTEPDGRGRTAPSAGGTYPLELYVVTADGLFHYVPDGHRLETLSGRDLRVPLAEAALGQDHVSAAAAVVVVTAVFARTEERYGERAERYVYLEAGHAAQNLLLQATALGLGAVPVGAFQDDQVGRLLGVPADQAPLYLIAVGHPT